MNKQYGLIIPGQQKKAPQKEGTGEFSKPAIFDESSSSESDDAGPTHMLSKKAPMGPSLMERRKAKHLQEKALAEDPTIFQYDELFDEMESKRAEEKSVKSKEPKKARYVLKLMEAAEKRKLENELRIERQVQKEREAEGDEFKDKEAFVTSGYRKKLEEMRNLEEQNKRNDYLEAIGDVTKQKDLDGFYRHIYEQKVGAVKSIEDSAQQPEVRYAGDKNEDAVVYKPIKSSKTQKQRAYRKRKSSDDENNDGKLKEPQDKKIHLTNNIDADSDFSIDDSSSESENDSDHKSGQKNVKTNGGLKMRNAINEDTSKLVNTASNLDTLQPLQVDSCNKDQQVSLNKKEMPEPTPPKQKRVKSEVWRRRTIGDVYIAAVERYYQRKSLRSRA